MNHYEAKKQARIERMRARAIKLDAVADANSMSIFREEKSGIPLGQPILIGHHSERRHRRHLERLEARLKRGFEAHDKARSLKERADSAESRKAIDSDNPEALKLLSDKIAKMESNLDRDKNLNKLVRKFKTVEALSAAIAEKFPKIKDPRHVAEELLTPDFAGRVGLPAFHFVNRGAEIRRLKKRLEVQKLIESPFEAFEINGVRVDLVEGQIQLDFPEKPKDETRNKLKRSPLALKWSNYSKKWVRKHTATTCGRYFQQELRAVLETWK